MVPAALSVLVLASAPATDDAMSIGDDVINHQCEICSLYHFSYSFVSFCL